MQSHQICSSLGFIRRRWWHPTPVLLPRKSHGWRSLVGYSPWGCKELDTTERLHFLSFFNDLFQKFPRDFLVIQWLRLWFPMQAVQAWSLVRALRSYMPCSQKKKKKNPNINNRSSIVTNAIDFKNGLHKKKIFKKTIWNIFRFIRYWELALQYMNCGAWNSAQESSWQGRALQFRKYNGLTMKKKIKCINKIVFWKEKKKTS